MSLGPVMLDVAAPGLDDEDRKRLGHPQVGGVILFSRNYESPQQLNSLIDEIHAIRSPRLVVAVDQEGGRVQRFRDGFQNLPAMTRLGECYDEDAGTAIRYAESFAWIMASELLHYGVDLSFSPVLDLGNPVSSVIGDRAFHQDPEVITRLANAWIRGMKKAGMEAIGKHFPGHGSVEGDSHHVMPFDRRGFLDIEALDLVPFRRVIATHLTGIMMAHVIYDQVDEMPAGYSKVWIEDVLRSQLGFDGIVFSDDLSMSGAESVGGYAERAQASLQAGCDILLVCNNATGADEVLEALDGYSNPTSQLRMIRMHGVPSPQSADLFTTHSWRQAIALLEGFNQQKFAGESGDLFEQC
ncbi:MAG: beta-N-acetylhexosaminidase [Gammaproteobacteria bacterium]|nr:beta-N-acetylhexosaminidase [Gammaproteobacteria bacterium]